MGGWCFGFSDACPFKSRGSSVVDEVTNSRTGTQCIIVLFNKSVPCVVKVDGDWIISLWAEQREHFRNMFHAGLEMRIYCWRLGFEYLGDDMVFVDQTLFPCW